MENARPRSLLVIKPSSFGDIVHTLPAVSRLKAAWPDCRVSWVANTEWMPLLAGNPAVDEVVEYPRSAFRGWGGGWRMRKWLRTTMTGRHPDLALDFQGLLRSALIGRASDARMFAGLNDAREGARWFYHRTIPPPSQPVHAIERYLALADAMLRQRSTARSASHYPKAGGTTLSTI